MAFDGCHVLPRCVALFVVQTVVRSVGRRLPGTEESRHALALARDRTLTYGHALPYAKGGTEHAVYLLIAPVRRDWSPTRVQRSGQGFSRRPDEAAECLRPAACGIAGQDRLNGAPHGSRPYGSRRVAMDSRSVAACPRHPVQARQYIDYQGGPTRVPALRPVVGTLLRRRSPRGGVRRERPIDWATSDGPRRGRPPKARRVVLRTPAATGLQSSTCTGGRHAAAPPSRR
jgi:hypothetical protein